jgi:Zn-dependent peptidase ImmA (M78 family)/transcriptional regulator with XRE-family HTH domain
MPLSREVLAQRIKHALHQSNASQRELAAAVDMDPTALSRALAGQRAFKSVEVALIAEHLGVSTDVLLAHDNAEVKPLVSVAARVQADVDGAETAVASAAARVEQMRELDVLLDDLGYPALPVPSLPALPEVSDPVRQGQLLAEAIRTQTGLGDEELPHELDDLVGWLDLQLGVDVCIAPLRAGLDGLALSCAGLRLVLVSSGVTSTRLRFTLAHELCHLASGDGQIVIDKDVFEHSTSEEKRANAFAAAFLMPATAMRTATAGRDVDESLVAELLGRFRVSLDALAFRLHNVGVIKASGRDRVRAMSSGRIALRPGRVEDLQVHNERRAPSRLLARAMEAYVAGDLGVRPLAALLDTDPDQLLDELSPPRFAVQSNHGGAAAYAL